jgi:hypothetical protein
VRNLPAAFAAAAFHPPVAPARAVLDLQEDLEHGGIDLAGDLALLRVATALRIERVEPNTTVCQLVDVLGPALAPSATRPSSQTTPPPPSGDLRNCHVRPI